MGRITRLPDDLANQIAAGEVVERPASVVKELIENAIDAGATRIAITVEYGGKKLIRVEDDGVGMDPDDARLCLERHATSKISKADDLGAIVTLGFRGEALPSMASVSHFRLRTRARGSDSGTEIRVNAGIVESVVEAGGPEGTMVEVADVFYNLPARRKFLKSDGAEAAQVSRVVTQLALCYPEVGFTLTSSGKKILAVPPVTSLSDRLYQIYGDRQDLIAVEREFGGLRLHGFIAALAEQGPVRGPQHVFVNRRIVKDRTIAHAIIDSYSVATNKERSPEVHLFLEIPPDRVDVNVHPTKAEVRFREQSLVHEMVRRALGDALGKGPAPELTLRSIGHSAWPPAAARTSRCSGRWQFPESLGAAHSQHDGSARGFLHGGPSRGCLGLRNSVDGGSVRGRLRIAAGRRPMIALGPIPRHVHHRDGRRGPLHHRSARGARAGVVRADHGEADDGIAGESAPADSGDPGVAGGGTGGAGCRRRKRSRDLDSRSRSSAATASRSTRCRRCCRRTNATPPCARWPTISRASIAACGSKMRSSRSPRRRRAMRR